MSSWFKSAWLLEWYNSRGGFYADFLRKASAYLFNRAPVFFTKYGCCSLGRNPGPCICFQHHLLAFGIGTLAGRSGLHLCLAYHLLVLFEDYSASTIGLSACLCKHSSIQQWSLDFQAQIIQSSIMDSSASWHGLAWYITVKSSSLTGFLRSVVLGQKSHTLLHFKFLCLAVNLSLLLVLTNTLLKVSKLDVSNSSKTKTVIFPQICSFHSLIWWQILPFISKIKNL